MEDPCEGDCLTQNYPDYPYGAGAEYIYSQVLPILLSAMVVVISWLAGRFIDKIEVATAGALARVKSGTIGQSVKRTASNDKPENLGFHSTASRGAGRTGVTMLEGVQELDGISVQEDEQNRLYHEEYGSHVSQEDGDRYDALGDSPGAQGPSSQGPRSPSVYSHFSQSVFSQSAYGPSAYGPSQRARASGSIYGQSQYGDGSSLGGSQYPGPVPSHFGASQMSSDRTSYHASNVGSGSGGGAAGVTAGVNAGRVGGEMALGHHSIPAPYGEGDGRGVAGAARMLPPPSYNPNPHAHRLPMGAAGVGSGGVGGYAGSRGGGGAAAQAAAAAAGAATAAIVAHDAPGFTLGSGVVRARLGSPPPYSQAASTLPREPRPSVDSRPSLDALQARTAVDSHGQRQYQALARTPSATAPPPAAGNAGAAPAFEPSAAAGAVGDVAVGKGLSFRGAGMAPGPSSDFGESDSEPGSEISEIPSTFRA